MASGLADLIDGIHRSPLPMVASNPRRPDNPLEVVNAAFCGLTGYREAEVVGRNCRFLGRPGADPDATRRIAAALRAARPVLAEIRNYRRDGAAFRNGVTITPLLGPDGEVAWFLGSQVDLGPAPSALEARRDAAGASVAGLPPRRRQVLSLMARGLLNKQIAWELRISEKTVKMHRALLLRQLGVATSADAIRLAIEAGL